MIEAGHFLNEAAARGIDFYTGVPCSFLTPLINQVASSRAATYVPAASEGEAVAIAAGAWLGGRGAAVMCQNSGLGNAVNPLTSLNHPFRIPALLVTTWRGQPGLKDEPQHEVMGQITQALLDTMRIPHQPFPKRPDAVAAALDAASAHMDGTGLPYALVMEQGSVADAGLDEAPRQVPLPGRLHDLAGHGDRPSRADLLGRLLAVIPDHAAVVATTGKCGRELFTLADRPQHLYQVGSMGGAAGMGLGVALTTGRRTVVLDGDGAALMKLGALATIGAHQPATLLHIVLDNGVHDSTGGQSTVSASVDFAAVALACGYQAAWRCDSIPGFEAALRAALAAPGPAMIHARIRPGSMEKLGRPTVPPDQVARRFQAFLRQAAAPPSVVALP